jgi:hypothetical protein
MCHPIFAGPGDARHSSDGHLGKGRGFTNRADQTEARLVSFH